MDFNYQEDLAIDPLELDEEWLTQSGKYMKYSELLADAEKEMKQAQENTKVTRSRLIRECKENDSKATAQIIESYYREHDDHISAKNAQIEAEYKVSMLSNAVFAFTHRRKALENLVQLHISNYFSSPREGRALSPGKRYVQQKEREETNKKVRQAAAKKNRTRTRTRS